MEGRAADRASGRDADHHRRGRGLRIAHPQPGRLSRGHEGFAVHYSHHVTDIRREPGGRWRIDVEDTEQRRDALDHGEVRLSRRRRRRFAAAAEIRHSGGKGLRRVPGQRHLAALR